MGSGGKEKGAGFSRGHENLQGDKPTIKLTTREGRIRKKRPLPALAIQRAGFR